MEYTNNRNSKNHFIATTATISVLATAIILVAASIVTSAAAQQTTTTTSPPVLGENTTTSTSSAPSSGINLSAQPIYEERSAPGNITPINQTHGIFTFNGTGMITLPNSSQSISTTHNGTAFISFATSSGYGKETIKAENGESVTATVYEIVQSNPTTPDVGKGIVTAVFQTNSTGMLAPLNGIILAGIDDMTTGGASHITLWRWESGISSSNTSIGANSITSNNSTGTFPSAPFATTQEAPPANNSGSTSNSNNNATTPITAANEAATTAASPAPAPSSSLTAPY
ncbi:MAG: hypothetical protein M3258_09640 [Thermoproteota archaeon]|nr:hypothetical protein [Thermoproteota archaeon]